MTRYCLFIGLIVLFFSQCKSDGTREQTSEVNADSLQTQLHALNDSLQTSWEAMIASDDEKISQISRLIKDIAQSCTRYDKGAYQQIAQQQAQITAKRYASPDSMTSEQIDRYDIATDSLLSNLRTFYQKTNAKQCCPLCDSLLNTIEQEHSEVVVYRIRYDNHAKEFNALVTQQKETLAALKPEYQKLKPKQLFSLMQ